MHAFDLSEFEKFLYNEPATSKVYIGTDSARFRRKGQWFVDYITVVVIHRNSKNGCKIFGEIVREPDKHEKLSRPFSRMMSETAKAVDMYQRIEDVLILADLETDPEIHLDINPDEAHGSSCAIQAAIGYVRGMLNVIPLVKPNAVAASYAADRYTRATRKKRRKLFRQIAV